MKSALIPILSAVLMSGCVSTVAGVVTAPVRVGAKAVRVAVPSRGELDRRHGRKLRKAESRARHACRGAGDKTAQRDCVRTRLADQGFF